MRFSRFIAAWTAALTFASAVPAFAKVINDPNDVARNTRIREVRLTKEQFEKKVSTKWKRVPRSLQVQPETQRPIVNRRKHGTIVPDRFKPLLRYSATGSTVTTPEE